MSAADEAATSRRAALGAILGGALAVPGTSKNLHSSNIENFSIFDQRSGGTHFFDFLRQPPLSPLMLVRRENQLTGS